VVLCDSELPDIGGLEMIRRVKAASPGTQVILMARRGGLEVEEVLREGGLDLVFKPFLPQEALQAVERNFGGMGGRVPALESKKEEIR
jgi:DNA-binding NtrC family response regulator